MPEFCGLPKHEKTLSYGTRCANGVSMYMYSQFVVEVCSQTSQVYFINNFSLQQNYNRPGMFHHPSGKVSLTYRFLELPAFVWRERVRLGDERNDVDFLMKTLHEFYI